MSEINYIYFNQNNFWKGQEGVIKTERETSYQNFSKPLIYNTYDDS
jgi:hypothetical protein